MRFSHEASKHFIGQRVILKELSLLINEIKEGDEQLNFLFEAPAGYGKNFLAYLMMEFLDPDYRDSIQYLPDKEGLIAFDSTKSFHYIDEAHMLSPQEQIYHYLSSHKYTIILGTNNFHLLEKPLVTRCLRFQFSEYSLEEIALIIQLNFESKNVYLPFVICKEIATYCRGIPRVAKELTTRLRLIFKQVGIPKTVEDTRDVLFEYLGQKKDGFTEYDERYLKALKEAGGTASLETLLALTNLPRKTITQEIEPFLMRKQKIKKSSKGRTIT